jgi:hypothetical protein
MLSTLASTLFRDCHFGLLPQTSDSLRFSGGDDGARTRDLCRDRACKIQPIEGEIMTINCTSDPLWIDESDWLCAVEFLSHDDQETRGFSADTIGYLLGYAHLTNTRSLALVGDADMEAYELLFSFAVPEDKARFLNMVRSNHDLGDEYVDNDLVRPAVDEIRKAQPIAAVLPVDVFARATLVATAVCSATPHRSSIN